MATTDPVPLSQTQEIKKSSSSSSRSGSDSESQDDSENSHTEDTEVQSSEEPETPKKQKRKHSNSSEEKEPPKKRRKIQRMIHTVPAEDTVVIFRGIGPSVAEMIKKDYTESSLQEIYPKSYVEIIPSSLVEIKMTEEEKIERKRLYRIEYQQTHVGKKKPDTPESIEARRLYNLRPDVQENKRKIAKAKRELLRQEKMKDPVAFKNKIKELKQNVVLQPKRTKKKDL